MSGINLKEWTAALTSMLEELHKDQYLKMLEFLEKIPRCRKTKTKYRELMPGRIIQCYGLEESISEIHDVMVQIQRNDPRIQDLLRPFVDKLRNEQEKENQGTKRKREDDGLKDEAPRPSEILGGQGSSCQLDRGRNAPWKKSIRDVKSGGIRESEGFLARVIQKSGLRPTKDKKFFFSLAVADETASVIVVIVCGKVRYEEIKEDGSYMFYRNLIKDEDVIKVTALSKVSEMKSVDVPEELQAAARDLFYPESPVYSVKAAKLSANKTEVSVKGSVTEIDPVEKIKVKHKRRKIKRQTFLLTDETDSIRIVMWNEGAVQQSEGLSIGDVVKVTNTKVNKYRETILLDSTGFTTVHKVQSVGIQKVRIEILGISKATKKETHLEAELNQQVQTFVVTSRLLATAFGFKLEGEFKERLLEEIPFSAEAEIQGVKITKITKIIKITVA